MCNKLLVRYKEMYFSSKFDSLCLILETYLIFARVYLLLQFTSYITLFNSCCCFPLERAVYYLLETSVILLLLFTCPSARWFFLINFSLSYVFFMIEGTSIQWESACKMNWQVFNTHAGTGLTPHQAWECVPDSLPLGI